MYNQNADRTPEELKNTTAEHNEKESQEIDLKEGVIGAYQKIEDGVVGAYQKIEDAVVGGYKKIEEGVVEGFSKMTDKFVEKLFAHEGETIEDAKKRLNGEKTEEDQ